MAKSRSTSAKRSRKKAAPPLPPPVVKPVRTIDDLERDVTSHAGSALLVVVSPLDAATTNTVVEAMERLNSSRSALLTDINIAVCYALPTTSDVCRSLCVTTVPFVQSYAYGEVVGEFIGDNTEKMELLAKMAATQAAVKAAQLAEEQKQRQVAAAEAREDAAAAAVAAAA
ncbi:conserved hypothetical protein [Leishmania infantum JPCM5]|uniref:Uncharacterized protein n=2 Tax=Leishmania infantum TaxID=5671 RepID=A4IBL3_LEIIN|nr:conserved hypothetical protein [Leishmania infantum JPCM5]CAC9545722.1 hypothetical_protein_-_conserved [Leishmania infantum]CAM72232.1 conserved hypothetical protein [Leishmania infantum JPCM5]SUZ46152.1 hypothetical_protein_-_conserved [Leishmania infantum]|eukprot:XP_001469132.1 conserved hypothetical protein [Leishmania infantum JPCM5]